MIVEGIENYKVHAVFGHNSKIGQSNQIDYDRVAECHESQECYEYGQMRDDRYYW